MIKESDFIIKDMRLKNLNVAVILILLLIGCSNYNSTHKLSKSGLRDTAYISSTKKVRASQIPDSVFQMVNLKHLSFIGMDCDYSEHTISCFTLQEIPSEIKNLKELVSLNFSINSIKKIPVEIKNLKNLSMIDLSDNSMLNNVDFITNCPGLKELNLYGCDLKLLPKDIGKLKKLRQLGLTGNPVSLEEIDRIKRALPNCQIVF